MNNYTHEWLNNKAGLVVFFLLLLLAATNQNVSAQGTATVYGKLLNAEGEPLEDISVSILGSAQPPVYTNKGGAYIYSIPANTDVVLVFYSLSHKREEIKLKLADGQKKEINKTLIFDNQFKTVEVTDNNSRYSEITTINPKHIKEIPTASQDFNAILFTLPGVSSRNELSSTYSVRGGNFNENLVYVNGIEIYRPFLIRSGQQEGLSFVNGDMVSSVMFSAGGFEAKYGDKMSSVLDITYRKPRKYAGSVSGSLLGSSLHLEGTSKNYRLSWIIGARYKTNKYVLKTIDTKGDYHPFFGDIQAFVTYDLTPEWEVDLLGNFASNKYQLIPQDRQTDFGTLNEALRLNIYFDGQEIDKFTTMMGATSFIYHDHNDKWNLRFIGSAFETHESENYDITGQYFIDELETDFGKASFGNSISSQGVGTFLNHSRTTLVANVLAFDHKGVRNFGASKQLLWGVRYSNESISDKISQWNYLDSAGYAIPNTDPQQISMTNVIKRKDNIFANRVSGYAEGILKRELADSSHISLIGGFRANYYDLNNQALFGPRATFGYKPNWRRDFLFKFSSGYYYQPPFYRELFDYYGNVNYNIKAQTSIHFVLSSDYNFKAWHRPFKFIVETYYKYLDHVIPFEINNVQILYSGKNEAKGYATGIDMKVNGEFVKDLESWASLSIMQTQEDIKGDYYYDYYNSDGEKITPGLTANNVAVDSVRHEPGYIPRPTDQRISFGMFFQDKMPGIPDLKMHLNMLFGTGVPFGPPNSPRYQQILRTPPYRRVDVGFSYQVLREDREKKPTGFGRLLKSMWVSLEVFNLLGTNNTVSYIWVTDITNRQYAVPNYLTQRQLNIRTIIRF